MYKNKVNTQVYTENNLMKDSTTAVLILLIFIIKIENFAIDIAIDIKGILIIFRYIIFFTLKRLDNDRKTEI
jgi:hypothetical protein